MTTPVTPDFTSRRTFYTDRELARDVTAHDAEVSELGSLHEVNLDEGRDWYARLAGAATAKRAARARTPGGGWLDPDGDDVTRYEMAAI
jgi:hypothetical protein